MILLIRKGLVHLRVGPSIKIESEYPTGLVSLSALIWADIGLLAVRSGPSRIIYKFQAACSGDTGRVPSKFKNSYDRPKLRS